MLDVRDLHAGYGRVPVLRGVSLSVPPNHIVGLLGANGAGKTTLIRAISGLAAVHSGDIRFHGASLTRIRPTYHGTAGPRPEAGGTPHHEAGRRPAPQTKEGQQP